MTKKETENLVDNETASSVRSYLKSRMWHRGEERPAKSFPVIALVRNGAKWRHVVCVWSKAKNSFIVMAACHDGQEMTPEYWKYADLAPRWDDGGNGEGR